jgi:hypothetical protein
MSEWIPFVYREFYDVPREILLTFKGKVLLLESLFDDKDDEYSKNYVVYELPASIMGNLNGSWEGFANQALSELGEIPVESVQFDNTRRKQIYGDVLEALNM